MEEISKRDIYIFSDFLVSKYNYKELGKRYGLSYVRIKQILKNLIDNEFSHQARIAERILLRKNISPILKNYGHNYTRDIFISKINELKKK